MNRKALGKFGERIAADTLAKEGYRIRDRNWRVLEGELDIVAEREGVIVFVEVKTRASDAFGNPEESITKQKQKRIVRAALAYLEAMQITDADWRVDMVAIECNAQGEVLRYDHYENTITGPLRDFL